MSPTPAKIPPKSGKSTVYVDVEDEITSIIDKVENAKDSVVALVLPKRAASLQSIVNMRLLQRAASNDGKQVVLVTSEEALLPLAGAAGLHVASSLDSAPEVPPAPAALKLSSAAAKAKAVEPPPFEVTDGSEGLPTKIDYNKTVGGLAAAHDEQNPETIELDDVDHQPEAGQKAPAGSKPPKDKKVKVPNFDRFRLMLGLAVAGLVALIVFIILALVVLPKATITLNTTSVPVTASLTLTTSPTASSFSEATSAIPAVLKTTQETATAQVTATGQQNNGTKATGSVAMTGSECAPNIHTPASIPAGTGVISGGMTYVTQTTTTFSLSGASGSCDSYSASPASTNIVAQTGGAKENVSGAPFTVSGRSDVSATGSTSGGTDNITTVVSQADLDGAKGTITSAASAAFVKTYETQLASQSLYVLTSTLTTSDPTETASPAVGQAASTTNVTVQITYTLLTIKKTDLQTALADGLAKQVDKTKQTLDTGDLISKATVAVQDQSSPTVATLSITANGEAVPIINVASLQKQVTGKKGADITNLLEETPGVKNVTVKFSPFWVSSAPKPSKVVIIQQHTSTGQ